MSGVDQKFIRQMREKVETELTNKETEVLAYWRDELNKTLKKSRQDLAGLTGELTELIRRMDRRIERLKSGK
jgi:hypothetical protein